MDVKIKINLKEKSCNISPKKYYKSVSDIFLLIGNIDNLIEGKNPFWYWDKKKLKKGKTKKGKLSIRIKTINDKVGYVIERDFEYNEDIIEEIFEILEKFKEQQLNNMNNNTYFKR